MTSPVVVSPLSHLEISFCIGKEHSFRALRNECHARVVCTSCSSIDKWFAKYVTISW